MQRQVKYATELGIATSVLGWIIWTGMLFLPIEKIGERVLIVILLSIGVSAWGFTKGYSIFYGLGMSLCLSPLIGSMVVLVSPKNEEELNKRARKNKH